MKTTRTVLLILFSLHWQSGASAGATSLVAELYANPPVPCVAIGVEAKSSLVPIEPTGSTREEHVGVMGSLASIFLAAGESHMTAENIDKVYTAVFFEEEPVNEVGIYAYRFRDHIDPAMFIPGKKPGARFFVIDGNLLVLLWREETDSTLGCFSALERILSDKP